MEYERLFADAPFARHGGLTGTTKRLSSWCMILARTGVKLVNVFVRIVLWSSVIALALNVADSMEFLHISLCEWFAHTVREDCESSGVLTTTSCAGLVFHWYTTLQCLGSRRNFGVFWEDLKRKWFPALEKKTPQGHIRTPPRGFRIIRVFFKRGRFWFQVAAWKKNGSTLWNPFRVAGALPFCIDRSLERLAYRIEERSESGKNMEDSRLGSLQSLESSPHEKKGSHDLNQTSQGIMCKSR